MTDKSAKRALHHISSAALKTEFELLPFSGPLALAKLKLKPGTS
jgi:hypothetical protein